MARTPVRFAKAMTDRALLTTLHQTQSAIQAEIGAVVRSVKAGEFDYRPD